MHAIYAFLLDIDDVDADDQDIVNEVTSTFEGRYAERYCDENNWYKLETLVMENGRVLNLCEPGDWRKRDGFVDFFLNKPQEERFTAAVEWAARVVAMDFGLRGAKDFYLTEEAPPGNKFVDEAPVPELLKAIKEEVPLALAKLYEKAATEDRYSMDSISRRQWSRGYDLFLKAHIPPFSPYLEDPYAHYRAFDLSDNSSSYSRGELGESLAVLFVDIHT